MAILKQGSQVRYADTSLHTLAVLEDITTAVSTHASNTTDGTKHVPLAGTTSTGKILTVTDATGNIGWTTSTYPNTVAKGTVLIATGANVVGSLAASGTNNYVLTFDTGTGLPKWAAPSAGSVSGQITLANGGTGVDMSNTTNYPTGSLVIIGTQGSNMGVVKPAATAGQLLINNIGAAPSWSSTILPTSGITTGDLLVANATNTMARLAIGANTYVLTSNGTTASWAAIPTVNLGNGTGMTGTLPVGNGGTGATTLTQYGVLVGEGTNPIQATAVGTVGQILVANTSANPSFSNTARLTTLQDSNGNPYLIGSPTASAVNYVNITNAVAGAGPTIAPAGTSTDTDLNINAKGAGKVVINSAKVTLAADPATLMEAATKQYVDNLAAGIDVRASVRVATTANITLSGTQTIDGIAVVVGDRVLVKNQTTQSQNGIYVVAAGAWTRSADANTAAELNPGMFTFVEKGTTQASTGWILNSIVTTVDTDIVTFTQFSGAGSFVADGTSLKLTGSTFSANLKSAGLVSDSQGAILVDGANGMYVSLGTTGTTAAPGDHTHSSLTNNAANSINTTGAGNIVDFKVNGTTKSSIDTNGNITSPTITAINVSTASTNIADFQSVGISKAQVDYTGKFTGTIDWAHINNPPTTAGGAGLTDVYTKTDIETSRHDFLDDYIVSGFNVTTNATALTVSIATGISFVGGKRFTTVAGSKLLTASTTQYIWIDSAGVFQSGTAWPGSGDYAQLAIVTVPASGTIPAGNIVDARNVISVNSGIVTWDIYSTSGYSKTVQQRGAGSGLNVSKYGTGNAFVITDADASGGPASKDVFVVDAFGNTQINRAGNFQVWDNTATPVKKFEVLGASGNTTIGGTLSVTGTTTLTGALTANGGITTTNILLTDDTNTSNTLTFTSNGTGAANRTLTWNVNSADRTVSLGGNLTLANAFSTSGAYAITLTATATTTVTLPTTGTLATTSQLHTQNTDTGTSSSTFYIGSSGPKLKNNSNVLEVRDNADANYANTRANAYILGDATHNFTLQFNTIDQSIEFVYA